MVMMMVTQRVSQSEAAMVTQRVTRRVGDGLWDPLCMHAALFRVRAILERHMQARKAGETPPLRCVLPSILQDMLGSLLLTPCKTLHWQGASALPHWPPCTGVHARASICTISLR
jgi:hypothetical protein